MNFGLGEKSSFVFRKTIDCIDINAYIHIDYEINRLLKKNRIIKIIFSKFISNIVLKIFNLKIASYIKLGGNTEKYITNKKVKKKIILAKLINIYSIIWDFNFRKELINAYKTIKEKDSLSKKESLQLEELIVRKINYLEKILHKIGVKIIYLSTTNTIESSIIIQAAKKLNIKIVQIASTAMQFSLIGYVPNVVDLIYVLSEKCKEKLLSTNHYHNSQINLYSVNSNLKIFKNNNYRTLLVFEQIRSALNPNIMKYWELIIKESSSNGELLVRLHPKQNLNQIKIKDIIKLKKKYQFKISKSCLSQDFSKVDRVIGTNSTVLIEASNMGLPVAQIKETKLDNYQDINLISIGNIKEYISKDSKILNNYLKKATSQYKLLDSILDPL